MSDLGQVLDFTAKTLASAEKSFKNRIFCPEANRYSRSFTDTFYKDISKLTAKEIEFFLYLVYKMDSNNIATTKDFKGSGLNRKTLQRTIKTLTQYYWLYIYPNKKVFINPYIVVLTKYRTKVLELQCTWNERKNSKQAIIEDESED